MLTSYTHNHRGFVHCDQPAYVHHSYTDCNYLTHKKLLHRYTVLVSSMGAFSVWLLYIHTYYAATKYLQWDQYLLMRNG